VDTGFPKKTMLQRNQERDGCNPVREAVPPTDFCMNTAADANLFSRLFDRLDDPNRLAIETAEGERITYGDLIARAGQFANVLVSRCVKPGDRVAVQVEKSVANLVLYLATVRAGAVYLPLNTAYTLNELDYFITDSEPSLVVESVAALNRRVGGWTDANRPHMVEIAPLERAFDQDEAPIQGMLCGEIAQVRAAQRALEGMDIATHITMHRTEYADRDLGILDILPPNCSKGHALADYARTLGLDASDVMAIGDNFNDQTMLEYAGRPVLMANAGDELQALGRQRGWALALSNDEDGVAETLEPLIRSAQEDLSAGNGPTPEVVTAEAEAGGR